MLESQQCQIKNGAACCLLLSAECSGLRVRWRCVLVCEPACRVQQHHFGRADRGAAAARVAMTMVVPLALFRDTQCQPQCQLP